VTAGEAERGAAEASREETLGILRNLPAAFNSRAARDLARSSWFDYEEGLALLDSSRYYQAAGRFLLAKEKAERALQMEAIVEDPAAPLGPQGLLLRVALLFGLPAISAAAYLVHRRSRAVAGKGVSSGRT
jgi:hypothetical protein